MKKKSLMGMAGAVCLLMLVLTGCGAGEEVGEEVRNNENSSNEITIAILFDNAFLESAARAFEDLHENRYTVNITVYDDWAGYSQIITTALMSGGGEDIIAVSPIPWQRLANVDMLVDLNSRIDIDPNTYYRNVMDAFLHNEGRYVMPLNFTINVLRLDDIVAGRLPANQVTLKDLLALANEFPDYVLINSPMGMAQTSLANRFFELDFDRYIDLVNRSADVDNEDFIFLLESIQSIGDDALRWPDPGETIMIWEDILFDAVMSSSGNPDYNALRLLANAAGEGQVTTHNLLAINANSTNQEISARFLAFLLSEDIQASPDMWANPINRNAAAEKAILTLASVRAGEGFDYETYGYGSAFDIEENMKMLNELAERLTLSGTSDPNIGDFVRTEMERFFNDEVTAQQAASNLQARLATYLNE